MGYNINSVVDTGGVPMYIIQEFLKEIPIDYFVELGTAAGDSAKEASKHFPEVITIEINEDRPQYDVSAKNIKWLTGRSIDLLPKIVADFVNHKTDHSIQGFKYALFWVDSHFDGDKPNDSPYKDCYLLEELDIISWYDQDSIVFIDDARLFMGNPPYPNNAAEWPTIQEIFSKFNEKFKYHYTTIIDDYIISIPDRIKWILDREWMSRYSIRYPNESDKLKSQVKDVYSAFQKYIQ